MRDPEEMREIMQNSFDELINYCGTLKNPHTFSQRVAHVVPGVVVYLTFTLMYGDIITHSFITCKLHLSSLAKSPNQCCKLSLKSPEGSG